MVTLHISYKNGCAYVAIEEDGKRRQHATIYENTENKEQNAFCAEVAAKVQAELGEPVQWKMAENKSVSSSTLMKAGIAVFVIGIVFALMVPLLSLIQLPSSQTAGSSYATSSSSVPSEASETSIEQPKERTKVFEFGDGYNDSNSSYSRYVGTITNVSDETHYFVQVRGSFQDEDENTIDTDWTYACGAEGLRPGESTKFTLSVQKDSRIKRISCSILDYK